MEPLDHSLRTAITVARAIAQLFAGHRSNKPPALLRVGRRLQWMLPWNSQLCRDHSLPGKPHCHYRRLGYNLCLPVAVRNTLCIMSHPTTVSTNRLQFAVGLAGGWRVSWVRLVKERLITDPTSTRAHHMVLWKRFWLSPPLRPSLCITSKSVMDIVNATLRNEYNPTPGEVSLI